MGYGPTKLAYLNLICAAMELVALKTLTFVIIPNEISPKLSSPLDQGPRGFFHHNPAQRHSTGLKALHLSCPSNQGFVTGHFHRTGLNIDNHYP